MKTKTLAVALGPLALLLALSTAPAQAQDKALNVAFGADAPTGLCSTGRSYIRTTNFHFYVCSKDQAWHDVADTAGVSYPLLAPAGTESAPSYSFSSESRFGLSRPAANTMSLGKKAAWNDLAEVRIYNDDSDALEWTFLHAFNDSYGEHVFMGCQAGGSGTNSTTYCSIGTGTTLPTVTAGVRYMRGSFFPITNNGVNLGIADTDGEPNISYWNNLLLSTTTQGCRKKALTAGNATNFVLVNIPTTATVNFVTGEIVWNAQASDATDVQTISGRTAFNCVNKSGTETCAALVSGLTTAVAASGGTGKDDIACTFTTSTSPSNGAYLQANCTTTEMTETSFDLCWRADIPSSIYVVLTPQ